ncbi:hypothetical protein GF373_17515 [bacterium]|nr:hypothetical protein [bacterium]
MKNITISLTKLTDMFVIPSINMSLNDENSGPIEIDFDSLSAADKHSVELALFFNNRLSSPDAFKKLKELDVDKQESVKNNVTQEPTETISEPTKNTKKAPKKDSVLSRLESRDSQRNKELVSLLKNNAATISKEVKKITNKRDLDFLHKTEKRGKKRKGVLKEIEKCIEDFESSVQTSIAAENEKPDFKEEECKYTVTEDEFEQVEIHLTKKREG